MDQSMRYEVHKTNMRGTPRFKKSSPGLSRSSPRICNAKMDGWTVDWMMFSGMSKARDFKSRLTKLKEH